MKISRLKVETIMVKNGIHTQNILADRASISRQSLCVVLNGQNCRPVTASRIADALGVDVTEILED